MTGQVKEEIITRWAELGLVIREGQICFSPVLLRRHEFLSHPEAFEYVDVSGDRQTVWLEQGSLAFTKCQTVFVVHMSEDERLVVRFSDGTERSLRRDSLGPELSSQIFMRTGKVARVDVFVSPDRIVNGDSHSPVDAGRPVPSGDGS
jgi:hypothetical protein